mgnify:CR=1 FL=1
MRTEEIQNRSGFKKGDFYHHFSSNLNIAYAVIDEYITDMVNDIV